MITISTTTIILILIILVILLIRIIILIIITVINISVIISIITTYLRSEALSPLLPPTSFSNSTSPGGCMVASGSQPGAHLASADAAPEEAATALCTHV